VYANGTLAVKDVSEADEGVYSCVGHSANSESQTQVFATRLRLACESTSRFSDFPSLFILVIVHFFLQTS